MRSGGTGGRSVSIQDQCYCQIQADVINLTSAYLSTMERTATFEVIVQGTMGGKPLMPEDFDIRSLRDLLAEVEVLLYPNDRRDRPVISYEVQEGSVRNIFRTGMQAVATAGAVLALVNSTGSLDVLEPRTAGALEAMQRWAIENDQAFILRSNATGLTELRIDRSTSYQRTEATAVETEVYLYGKVVDAGGKERPNIHLQVDGQGMFVIDAQEKFLAGLKENILYHTMGVRATGRQNLQTGEIEKRSLRLIELIDYEQRFQEDYVKRLQAKASQWLKNVDPDQYLRAVRGEYGS